MHAASHATTVLRCTAIVDGLALGPLGVDFIYPDDHCDDVLLRFRQPTTLLMLTLR